MGKWMQRNKPKNIVVRVVVSCQSNIKLDFKTTHAHALGIFSCFTPAFCYPKNALPTLPHPLECTKKETS